MEMKFDIEEQLQLIAKVPKAARMGLVAAVLVGIACGYYFLSYGPQRVEVVKLRTQAQQLQRKLNNVRAVATNLGAFEQEVTDLERDLEKALKQLPNRKQFEDLLQDISTAGKQVGVQIKSIEREAELAHDFYAEVPFKLELEGEYHDLARFFERVARLPRIVNIGALDVTVATEGRRATVLKVKGTATTFRFLNTDNEEQASSAAPAAKGRRA
jgi:type IV pilus assembly protein PilO